MLARRPWITATLASLAALGLPRVARAAAQPRVLLLGDSMIAGALGLFLERGLRAAGHDVHRRAKSSTGLARPDFFNWMKEARAQVEAFPDADGVIVMFGGNDVQGLRMPERKWIRWPDEGWAEEYARRVNEFADIVAPPGTKLYWIGMPVMRPEKFHARIQRVNTIYRAEMAIRPDARFVDIWRLLADESGAYTHHVEIDGKRTRVRAGDGIHLSPAGAHVVEAHVRGVVVGELGGNTPPAAGVPESDADSEP
ncbi:MAG: DUF459 domain-containing protein [Nannocystaceae bacterium]|nr:DUF459 domain-containing protein [Myxococcales bacterium]